MFYTLTNIGLDRSESAQVPIYIIPKYKNQLIDAYFSDSKKIMTVKVFVHLIFTSKDFFFYFISPFSA